MDSELVGLAFAAGMVAAFNPCGFAMLPAYLALVINGEDDPGSGQALGRALAATAAMAAGFLTVFGLFGLLTVSVASTVQQYAPYLTVAGRDSACGPWHLAALGPRAHRTELESGAVRQPLGADCATRVDVRLRRRATRSPHCRAPSGPFLAVTGSSMRSGSTLDGLLVYVAYAAGIALVVGVLAVAVALANSALIDRMRRVLPYVNRISGVVLVVVGLYVGYYGVYEIRLFSAGGSAQDPVDQRGGPTPAAPGGLGLRARRVAVGAGRRVAGAGGRGGVGPAAAAPQRRFPGRHSRRRYTPLHVRPAEPTRR